MKRKTSLYIATIFSMMATALTAQPDWSVTPSDFQYTMTVVGVAVFQCEESSDENDLVAAFINGEVRGVQLFDTDEMGRKYAYMVIYDNDFSGNEITFQLYDASEHAIVETLYSIGFEENGNYGDVVFPFEFKTDFALESLYLSKDSISEEDLAGAVVAEIFAVNENQDLPTVTFDFVNDSLGVDNGHFSIEGNLLVLEENVNVISKPSYQIHLSGTTGLGCTIQEVVALNVSGPGVLNSSATIGTGTLDVTMYPNPASDVLYFDTEIPIDFVGLYDLTGKLVYGTTITIGQGSIDVSKLQAQPYMTVFKAGGVSTTKKLTIQH